jgi:hypothetical protein
MGEKRCKKEVNKVGTRYVWFQAFAEYAVDAGTYEFVVCGGVDAPSLMRAAGGHELCGKGRSEVCHTIEETSLEEFFGKDEIDNKIIRSCWFHAVRYMSIHDDASSRFKYDRGAIYLHVEAAAVAVGDEDIGIDVLGDSGRFSCMETDDVASIAELASLPKEEDLSAVVLNGGVELTEVREHFGLAVSLRCRRCAQCGGKRDEVYVILLESVRSQNHILLYIF